MNLTFYKGEKKRMTKNNDIAWYSVFKPSWYVSQMKGWSLRSYFLLILGIGLIAGMTMVVISFNSVTLPPFLPES